MIYLRVYVEIIVQCMLIRLLRKQAEAEGTESTHIQSLVKSPQ